MSKILNIHRDGRPFQMGDTQSRVLISPEMGARFVTFNYISYGPNAEFPQHLHDHSEDVFLVLEGSGWLREGDQRTPIAPGDLIYVPPGEVHGTVAGPNGMVVISCQGPPDSKLYTGERDSSRMTPVVEAKRRPPENEPTAISDPGGIADEGSSEKASHDLELPADLVAFLAAGMQLEYDPEPCEAGAITLVPHFELKLERFPVETGSLAVYEQDPHYPDRNSYLVLGVNLVASCTGGYEAVGLLLWLPVERRYGIWDSSHCGIQTFGPDVTWERIVANPVAHINAGWTGIDPEAPPMEHLVPWPAHPYHAGQVYKPQPA